MWFCRLRKLELHRNTKWWSFSFYCHILWPVSLLPILSIFKSWLHIPMWENSALFQTKVLHKFQSPDDSSKQSWFRKGKNYKLPTSVQPKTLFIICQWWWLSHLGNMIGVWGKKNLSQCNEEMTRVKIPRLPHSSVVAFRYFGIDKFWIYIHTN